MISVSMRHAFEWVCPECGEEWYENDTAPAFALCDCGVKVRLHRPPGFGRSWFQLTLTMISWLVTITSISVSIWYHHRTRAPIPRFTDDSYVVTSGDVPVRIVSTSLNRKNNSWFWSYSVFNPMNGEEESWEESALIEDSSAAEKFNLLDQARLQQVQKNEVKGLKDLIDFKGEAREIIN